MDFASDITFKSMNFNILLLFIEYSLTCVMKLTRAYELVTAIKWSDKILLTVAILHLTLAVVKFYIWRQFWTVSHPCKRQNTD